MTFLGHFPDSLRTFKWHLFGQFSGHSISSQFQRILDAFGAFSEQFQSNSRVKPKNFAPSSPSPSPSVSEEKYFQGISVTTWTSFREQSGSNSRAPLSKPVSEQLKSNCHVKSGALSGQFQSNYRAIKAQLPQLIISAIPQNNSTAQFQTNNSSAVSEQFPSSWPSWSSGCSWTIECRPPVPFCCHLFQQRSPGQRIACHQQSGRQWRHRRRPSNPISSFHRSALNDFIKPGQMEDWIDLSLDLWACDCNAISWLFDDWLKRCHISAGASPNCCQSLSQDWL